MAPAHNINVIQPSSQQKRISDLQNEVEEVTELMKVNIQKEYEREGKISDLDRRAEQLNEDAAQFQKCAEKITKKMWWQDTKAKIGLGAAIFLVVLLVIIVPLSLSGVAAIGSRPGENYQHWRRTVDLQVQDSPSSLADTNFDPDPNSR